MDSATVQTIIDNVMPGAGNVQDGPVRLLENGAWLVPFRNAKHGRLQAFLKDRAIDTADDMEAAVKELSQSVGSALLNCM
jgi:hypothetical protein